MQPKYSGRSRRLFRHCLSRYLVSCQTCVCLLRGWGPERVGPERVWSWEGGVLRGQGPERVGSWEGEVLRGCGPERVWSWEGVVPRGWGPERVGLGMRLIAALARQNGCIVYHVWSTTSAWWGMSLATVHAHLSGSMLRLAPRWWNVSLVAIVLCPDPILSILSTSWISFISCKYVKSFLSF